MLAGEIKKIAERPDFRAMVEKSGASNSYMGPEELPKYTAEQVTTWGAISANWEFHRNEQSVHAVSRCGASRSTTASCCRRCASTRRKTASPATGTWRISGTYALANLGLAITEATAVEPKGRISPMCLGLYSDAHQEVLARILRFYRDYGTTKFGIQLAHAGRKSSVLPSFMIRKSVRREEGGWIPMSPSHYATTCTRRPPS